MQLINAPSCCAHLAHITAEMLINYAWFKARMHHFIMCGPAV